MNDSSGDAQSSQSENPHSPALSEAGFDNASSRRPPANTLAFVLPFVLFMLIASRYPQFEPVPIEPSPGTNAAVQSDSIRSTSESVEQEKVEQENSAALADVDVQPRANPVASHQYQWMVGLQVIVGIGLVSFWFSNYRSHFPIRVSGLAILVGAVGIVFWIGITSLEIEAQVMEIFGVPRTAVARAAFNPYLEIPSDAMRYLFLGLRFTLLAAIVPMIEELFLRGWLVRWVESADQWNLVSLGRLGVTAILAATVYGIATHPAEAVAAAVWFSMVTWLVLRTGNFWDAVVAHAVTNLLLGIYICYTAAWHLW